MEDTKMNKPEFWSSQSAKEYTSKGVEQHSGSGEQRHLAISLGWRNSDCDSRDLIEEMTPN